MHPRYRRALIPGLLVALLVVVLIAAVAKQARADQNDPTPGRRVSAITDSRIAESSGLVVSTRNSALGYTLNDSGNAPRVFAVNISTGKVVGVTTLTGYEVVDTEALTVDRTGRLWVADIGDNNGVRPTVALYALHQPGRGTHAVEPARYRLKYSDGPQDAETLLANPGTGTMFVVSKGMLSGQVYRLPKRLSQKHVNVMTPVVGAEAPIMVTDGDFLPDGSHFVLRNYLSAFAYDASTWKMTWSTVLPRERQGESLAIEPSGTSFLINTEGLPSPILRVELPASQRATLLEPAGGIIFAG